MDASRIVAIVVAGAVAYWVITFIAWHVARFLATRVRSDPATAELVDTPPAVVSLLTTGMRGPSKAAGATLLDLAARGFLELYDTGLGHRQTRVRARDIESEELTSYERRMLKRVSALDSKGSLTLGEMARRPVADEAEWRRRFLAEVHGDARDRRLIRPMPGWDASTVFVPLALAFVFVTALGMAALLAVQETKWMDTLGFPLTVLGFFAWIGLIALTTVLLALPLEHRLDLEVPTRLGRRTAAHWLGVRRWLRSRDGLREAAPAAVGVWGRQLAYVRVP